jgi:hypothetical protein
MHHLEQVSGDDYSPTFTAKAIPIEDNGSSVQYLEGGISVAKTN